MTVALIGWGRFIDGDGDKVTVPAPPSAKLWLWEFLREQAGNISKSFDAVQLPPVSKVQGGSGSGCDGYEVFDLRDLGSKLQQGSRETRYGSLENLMSAISSLNANGVNVWGDLVLHQKGGENGGAGVFRYLGADGHTFNGRGGCTPGWFRGQTSWNADKRSWNDPVPPFSVEDSVPVRSDDFAFGREISYQNCKPEGASLDDARDFLAWVQSRLNISTWRFDDTKGTNQNAVKSIMNSAPDSTFYSEYFDGNPTNLNWWATSDPMASRSGVEDFTLHWRIQAACNGFDATQFDNGGAGYWEWNSDLAYGFVDNPDTDTSPGQQVIFNKGIAYAYLLTLPLKAAMVYGKDYFGNDVWPGAYGLKPLIDNLCWISRMFAFGAYQVRWVDKDVHVASRDGNGGSAGWSGGLLTAINFNTLTPRTVTVGTPFGANRQLHDYTGHHPDDIWTDNDGNATFTIPPNSYSRGTSYLCFAPAGVNKPVDGEPQRTTHVFEGAIDLDVMPAKNGLELLPQRIHVASGTKIDLDLAVDTKGWTGSSQVFVIVANQDGETISTLQQFSSTSFAKPNKATKTGWHTITLTGHVLPPNGSNFKLKVTYTGAI